MVEKNKKVKINFFIPGILSNSRRKSPSENSFFPKNHRGWIRIVEAFVAILLITGVLLIVLNQEYIGEKDISPEIYKIERSILKEIQLDDELRNDILDTTPPVTWNDANFPLEVKNKIISRLPSYLNCEAKICTINEVCILDTIFDREIYAQSVSIIAQLTQYNPRQLKLFCWIGVAPGIYVPTCAGAGGEECETGYYCSEDYLSANDTEECCPAGACVEEVCEAGWYCKPDTFFLAYQNESCVWSNENCDITCGADCEDERNCYTGPAETEDIGICIGGEESCTETCEFSGVCEDEVLPEEEGTVYGNCIDGLDNDCDGMTDTDPECF